MNIEFDLIVTIVRMGFSEKIIEASRQAGAEGGTIIVGRGTGVHERKKLLGIPVEPEKEIIFSVVPRNRTQQILEAIVRAGELDKPGAGIAFVLELKQVAGICHLLYEKEK
ncbi:MAG: P-II family nitrogen regulator [Candidatus Aminicenantes bacterium]|uniref:Nitrogen regulatory protein P-II n=1 Tax=Candidatus Saccharicenans subterraneus TaxID=2508984 RepID=A0A3E2BKK1_9BACT|nr:P-II family nitrogen regulator [Candidatus Aminicenantes bacterium]RFT15167.1 MAG: Nitrogen regulatory protein P-II [Candidatus Saccharicenans subterraneum]